MIIQFEGIFKSYSVGDYVLKNISFNAGKGECLAILGKNGSGKSTIFKLASGLVRPDTGIIRWKGSDICNPNSKFKENCGFLLDIDVLIEELTGLQYLHFVAKVFKLDNDTEKQIEKITSYFFENELELNQKIGSYSTGMKKKILFCSTVLHRPSILILDEPFSGLDSISSNRLIHFLQSFAKERTILIASHNLSYIEKIATNIIVLDDGEIKFNGKTSSFNNEGEKVIEESLYQFIQPEEYKVSLTELSWFFRTDSND